MLPKGGVDTDRRTEIIYATLELAAENGLRAVSMQQIADKVGIKKASVYNHFKSKEEIIEAMYSFLREQSKSGISGGAPDMEALMNGRTLKEILILTVGNYRKMSTSPEMYTFYKIIMSERSLDKNAAEIMAAETEKMVGATTMLFYALQAKGFVDMKNIETAAFSFALCVSSIINYECDLAQSGRENTRHTLESYIDEFCSIYGKERK